MSSNELSKAQARKLHDSLFSGVNVRLKKRMEKTGFPQDDKVQARVRRLRSVLAAFP